MNEKTTLYRAQRNECISSIAFEKGFFWQTLWSHPENAHLRNLRKDPHVLFEDDEVFIPERCIREESCEEEKRHRFRRKGIPGVIRLRLLAAGEPRTNKRCVLEVDGKLVELYSDAEGMLEMPITPNAKRGVLTIEDEGRSECYTIKLGMMNPVTEFSGQCHRLVNLGLIQSTVDDLSFTSAVRMFQAMQSLDMTGRVDAETQQALVKEHKC